MPKRVLTTHPPETSLEGKKCKKKLTFHSQFKTCTVAMGWTPAPGQPKSPKPVAQPFFKTKYQYKCKYKYKDTHKYSCEGLESGSRPTKISQTSSTAGSANISNHTQMQIQIQSTKTYTNTVAMGLESRRTKISQTSSTANISDQNIQL